MSRVNRPLSGPSHRARVPSVPGVEARLRRNAAHETTPIVLDGPFTVDRQTGRHALAHDNSLRVSQNKIGLNPLPSRPDLPTSTTLDQFIAAHNRLLADLRAKGMMQK